MILTGPEITERVRRGHIVIDPFSADQVNPNSYNFRLGSRLTGYAEDTLDVRGPNPTWDIEMDQTGFLLTPGRIYVGHTVEVIGTSQFVPMIHARSSVARLGLFVHVTASLVDLGSIEPLGLQLHAVQPIRVYPGMLIGQATFWRPSVGPE